MAKIATYKGDAMIRKSREADTMTDVERTVWNIRAVAVLIPLSGVLSYFVHLGLIPQVLFWGAVLILFVAFSSIVYDGGTLIEKTFEAEQVGSSASLFGKSTRLQLTIGIAIYLAPHLATYAIGLFSPTLRLAPTEFEVLGAFDSGAGAVQQGVDAATTIASSALPMVLHATPFLALLMLLPFAFFFLPTPINMLFTSVALGTFAMAYVLLVVTISLYEVLGYNLTLLPFVVASSLLAFTLNHHPKSYSMRKK